MKMFWNKLNKLQKWSLILFASCLITMILGLVLIGTVENGFLDLKLLGTGAILQLDKPYFPNSGNLLMLKFGTVFATIITPILFGLSIFTFGYHIYQIKIKGEK